MRTFVLFATMLLIVVCKAQAQDTGEDAFKNGFLPHDGSIIKDIKNDADRASHAIAATRISAEAYVLMEQGDFEAAEKRFQQARAADYSDGSSQALAQLGLAELCESQGRYTDAIGHFRALYSLSGAHDYSAFLLGDSSVTLYSANEGTYIRSEAVTHMKYALTLAEADRWAEAVGEYEEALARFVFKSMVYRLAVKRIQTARQGRSVGFPTPDVLEKAMSRSEVFRYLPSEWNVHFQADRRRPDALKAMAHLFIGAHRKAFEIMPASNQLAHLRQSLHFGPANPYAYYEYGVALKETKQFEEAKKALLQAEQLVGTNADLFEKIQSGLNEMDPMFRRLK